MQVADCMGRGCFSHKCGSTACHARTHMVQCNWPQTCSIFGLPSLSIMHCTTRAKLTLQSSAGSRGVRDASFIFRTCCSLHFDTLSCGIASNNVISGLPGKRPPNAAPNRADTEICPSIWLRHPTNLWMRRRTGTESCRVQYLISFIHTTGLTETRDAHKG